MNADRVTSGVSLLCTIVAKLDAQFAELPEHVSSACEPYRVIEIDIVMFPDGNTLDFSVYFQNQRLEVVSSSLFFGACADHGNGRRSNGQATDRAVKVYR